VTELSHGLGIFWSTHPQSIGLFDYRSQPDKHLHVLYESAPALMALPMLEEVMTPAQIEEAKQLARKWKPKGQEEVL